MRPHDIDAFTQAYIDAALWSSTAYGSPDDQAADPNHTGTFDRSFQDCNYDVDCLSAELLDSILKDCAAFQHEQADLLSQAGTDEQNGHDFWLTRNGHGAGFWDRGYPDKIGEALTDACKPYGSEDWYVDDPSDDYSGKICK